MLPPPRTQQQRKQDALNRLERDTDAWKVFDAQVVLLDYHTASTTST